MSWITSRFAHPWKNSSGWKCVTGQFARTHTEVCAGGRSLNHGATLPPRGENAHSCIVLFSFLFFFDVSNVKSGLSAQSQSGNIEPPHLTSFINPQISSRNPGAVTLCLTLFPFVQECFVSLVDTVGRSASHLWAMIQFLMMFSCSPFPGLWCLFRETFQHRCS